MGVKSLFLVFLLFGALAAILVNFYCPELLVDREPPVLKDGWWGKGPVPKVIPKDDASITPFKVQYDETVITDLIGRLNKTRLPEPLESVQFQYGFHAKYLQDVLEYWKTKYSWKKEVTRLNQFSQFTTKIEGIDIHYIHVKPTVPKNKEVKVLPLMLIHGWPGSVAEFYKIIPLLKTVRDTENFVFEVICPSIPGYGFSEAPHHPGFDAADASRIFVKLMHRLGHKKFYVQGGDWGAIIGYAMATIYAENLYGVHFNMIPPRLGPIGALKLAAGTICPSIVLDAKDHHKLYPLLDLVSFLWKETGYMHIQATKPDTIGTVLTDSPAGLAAYILEKFSTWTDPANVDLPDGGLTKKYTLDELLTNVMIYWVTNSITSSQRFYKENFNAEFMKLKIESLPVKIPSAYAAFPNEIIVLPETFVKHQLRNLVRYTDMPRGGHFGAFEEPQLLSNEIWTFVAEVEKPKPKPAN